MFRRRKPEEPPASPPPALPPRPAPALDAAGKKPEAATDDKRLAPASPESPTAAAATKDPSKPDETVTTAPTSNDAELGVPPFRPAAPKEPTPMARPPFPTSPTPSPSSPPLRQPLGMMSNTRPTNSGPSNLAVPAPSAPATAPEPAPRRTLVVGRGISLQGTVQDAERLVVDGTVEASMIRATELSVSPGGMFKGEIEVEDAEVAGTIDGTVTARGSLIVRASGKVLGTAHCRRLQVEDGGQITGRIEMITDATVAKPVEAH